MTEQPPEPLFPPRDTRSGAPGPVPQLARHEESPLRDGITVASLVLAVRHHLLLVGVIALLTLAATAFLLYRASPEYRATAVLRMASERRNLASGVDNPPAATERTVDPLLSLVQILNSRTLLGSVVDTLGLQLEVLPTPIVQAVRTGGGGFSGRDLRVISIEPTGRADTLSLHFGDSLVTAIARGAHAEAPYGAPLRLGRVRFIVPAPPGVQRATLVVLSRDVAIDHVAARLKVAPRAGTDVIDVRYTGPDPALAQAVVNTLARQFEAAAGRAAQKQAQRRRVFLEEQLRVTDSMLATAERNLAEFRSRQQMGSSGENLSAEQATLAAIAAQRAELESDRYLFSSLLEKLEAAPAGQRSEVFRALAYSPEVASDGVLSHLHQQLIDYRARLDSLTTGPYRSSPTDPDVMALNSRARATEEELVSAFRSRVSLIDTRLEMLNSRRTRTTRSVQSLPAAQAEEARHDRRVQTLQTTADALRQEHEKARIAEALEAADVEVLDLAPMPYRRTGVPRSVGLALGLLLGLFLGGGTAFLAELRNRSVRRPEELQQTVGAIELAVIPRIHRAGLDSGGPRQLLGKVVGGNPAGPPTELVVSKAGTVSHEAEAFRMLRTSLNFCWGQGPVTVVVTSAVPQEGKTLIAANLAATFARSGSRVLLVDSDLHRPRLHRMFRVDRSPGLTEWLSTDDVTLVPTYSFLAGAARSREVDHGPAPIRKSTIDRLSLLTAGRAVPNGSELLEPARLRARLYELQEHFDVIILDSPPVLVSADAATLAASAHGVIVVVRAGNTDRGAAELAFQRLTSAGARVFGAVLNDPEEIVARFAGKRYYAYDYQPTSD
jgi:succinoglycan biosynthesis transport protein ExoP